MVLVSGRVRRVLDELRPPSLRLFDKCSQALSEFAGLGVPLCPPLSSLRVLSLAPGLKVIFVEKAESVYIAGLYAARCLRRGPGERFGAVLLAAGDGRCCCPSENLHQVDGTPAALAAAKSFLRGGVASIVMVLGHEAERLRRFLACASDEGNGVDSAGLPVPDRTTVAYNSAYHGPMSKSLKLGVRLLEPGLDGIVMGLGNRPLLRPETVKLLLEAFRKERPLAVRPVYEARHGHPVVFHPSLADRLGKLGRNESLRDVLAGISCNVLDLRVEDPGVLKSVRDLCHARSDRGPGR